MPRDNHSGGRGPHRQPDLEELLKRGQEKLKQAMPGGSGLGGLPVLLLAVVLAAAAKGQRGRLIAG